ncbi:MAG: Holliday junction resolvase RuvX [Mycoplasmatota bacterium]
MRYLGLDLGTKTLGLSISDKSGLIARTYKTIRFLENDYDVLFDELKNIITCEQIDALVLGLPKNMNNTIGPRAQMTIEFQEKLQEFLNMDVYLQDERLTTVSAHNIMIGGNVSRKKRKEKVDSLAANIILQTYLDKMKGMN